MQQWTIRFAGEVHDTVTSTGCSIATALEKHIAGASMSYLEKIREAATDLDRIVSLEIARRFEAEQDAEDAGRPKPLSVDRRLRLRVYHNGTIVVHVDAPKIGKTVGRSTMSGWPFVLKLIERCEREWSGLAWDVVVRHQGIEA